MSYVLFSQSSNFDGLRQNWNVVSVGPAVPTQVNGGLAFAASSSYDEAGAFSGVTGQSGAVSGSDFAVAANGAGVYRINGGLGSLGTVLAADRNVLQATGAFAVDGFEDRRLAASSGLSDGGLVLALNSINYNDLKNVEVKIGSADLGTTYGSLSLGSFVDARVQIGDTAGAATQEGSFTLAIEASKRGEIDALLSSRAVDATLGVWSDGSGWQNSFAITGSVYGDSFTLGSGEVQIVVGQTISAPRFGATYDPNDFNPFDGSAISVSDGRYTAAYAQLGAGADGYDSSVGSTVASPADGQTTPGALLVNDFVWGGSGNDTIRTGAGDDRVFGDYGTVDGIVVVADPLAPASTTVSASGSDIRGYAEVAGFTVGYSVFNSISGSVFLQKIEQAAQGDANARGSLLLDIAATTGAPVGLTAAAAAEARGLGAYDPSNPAPNNGIDPGNPEISQGANGTSDVITLILPGAGASLGATFSMFYGNDDNSGATETATITFSSGGIARYFVTVGARDGAIIENSSGLAVSVDSVIGDGSQVRGNDDAALVNVSVSGPAGFSFDTVQFSANYAFRANADGSYTQSNASAVSDYYLKSVSYVTAPTQGNDLIDAGAGNDLVVGGGDLGRLVNNAGTLSGFGDTLTGGAGNDTFRYVAGDGVDLVTDFTVGQDVLELQLGGRTLSVEVIGGGTLLTFGGISSSVGAIYLANVAGALTAGTDYILS